ncbi:efflux RND transporter periplasmic adaptor subunit [Rhodopseudomonas palustris]|uniref:Efflux RND transporter periplasmic adaptor subunit n=1 Tax=Rhodopseudomonas palustris TaxID=1076 RepID=A0A418VLZ3_RHOPL|nr:efflux RND transporter periplasmic adaptor subunit [Rhodopseudomonas palustris]RJF77144.1 efflux RND transporter periplasmic adaptor subunit [Rhodopseudomonas palustris]
MLRAVTIIMSAVCLTAPLAAAPVRAGDELAISAVQAERVGIETSPLEQQPAPAGLSFPGRITVPPDRTRLMNAQLGGRVERLLVRTDAVVKAGDVLAEIQSPALASAQSEFLVAFNKERLLKTNLDREEQLAPYGAVPRKQVIVTQSEYDQARATAAERRAALLHVGMTEAAIDRLTATQKLDPKLTLIAPIDGVVLDSATMPGQTVEALALIFKLAQLSPLWAEVQVPALRAEDFAVGARVTLKGHDCIGRVVSIGSSVEPTSQTVIVRAQFDEPDTDLRPGQMIEAQIASTASGKTEWRVRTGAMVRRGPEAYVFVQTDTGFVATPVKVREELPAFAVVSGSFRGDERIVVRGVAALKGAWQGLGGVE